MISARPAAAHETDEPLGAAFGGIHPRLSPSGEHVACSYQGAIWRLRRSDGVLTRLTDGEGFDVEPAWSPDGKWIAYVNSRTFSTGALKIIQADDGAPLALGSDVAVMSKLSFDPAGQRLLAYFQATGQDARLGWFDWQAGQLTPLAIESQPEIPLSGAWSYGVQPALSHDGQWIAVRSTLDLPDEQMGNNGPQCDLWKVPAAGGKPERIVRFPARIHDLCWRADDRALYVVTELGGVHNDLWEVPLDEPLAGARKLTFGQTDEDRPSTSTDGRWLLYTDNHRGPTALTLRDLDSRRDEFVDVREFDYRRPTGEMALKIVESGRPAPSARVSIRHSAGKFHAPPGALYRLLNSDMHFYARGQAGFVLPEGHYQLKVARGPEYRVALSEFDVRAGQVSDVSVELVRWTDQRAEGWVAGENHIHANYGYGHWYNSPHTMLDQCLGEDLTVANFMVANSDGDGVYDREHFRGRPDPLSNDHTVLYWNEEFRSTIWGHMTLLKLQQLVTPIYTGFFRTTHPYDVPTNADIADHTHDQDGFVNYTHPAQSVQDPYLGAYTAKEMPIDVALGKIDSIDVMGSNQEANMAVWYRLLNCGLHVPASAGTDCFLNRIVSRLPGSDRVYVDCGSDFSYDRWIAGLREGKSFVTNGPMLRFSAADQGLGGVVRLSEPGSVRVEGRADWLFPLQSVEVLLNGQVAAAAKIAADATHVQLNESIQVDRSGWLALRVRGGTESDQLRGPAFAHSGAVYVEVEGRPIEAREDAEYFLTWIDRLWEQVRKRNRIPAGRQTHVEEQIAAARAVYRKLAGQGNEPAGGR